MGEKKNFKDGPKQPRPPQRKSGVEKGKVILLAACLAVIAGVTQQVIFATKSLPSKLPPIEGLPVDKKSWGAYRAHTYFGLRTKETRSPLFGMMWNEQPNFVSRPNIRHWCDQGDGISRYGWDSADGRTFGIQNITDKTAKLKIEWVNHLDTWTARVKLAPIKKIRHTFTFYFASQDSNTKFILGKELNDIIRVEGSKYGGSVFSVSSPQAKKILYSTLLWDDDFSLTNLNELLLSNTGIQETTDGIVYQLNPQRHFKNGRFVAIQFNVPAEVSFELSFSSRSNVALKSSSFDQELKTRLSDFQNKFEKTFKIQNKMYTVMELSMARVALSNMLGSLGYWFGHNRVAIGKEVANYGPHVLFSAVPSRPFFPRGFLWDEGFHNVLISKFDPTLTIEIISSWLNIMNEDGWIPREMILGEESEARVPAEYIVQRTDNANPPSLFLVFDRLVQDEKVVKEHGKILASMYPKLEKWFNWLLISQRGKKKGTFRWRGRNETTELELNPKTLASGLDDSPRASHPSSDEYHLDLRCWLTVCSNVMARLSSLYGSNDEKQKYNDIAKELNDYDSLVRLHWSNSSQEFCDYGKHSTKVKLAAVVNKMQPGTYTFKRIVQEEPKLRLVDDSFGYINLFPLMMKLIPANAKELPFVLKKLRDTKEIWTDFGLRSISLSSPYYAARNTEHDPPYWRGNIWINMNYLVISALKHYSTIDGPVKEECGKLFAELRNNVIKNMAKEFTSNGYLWEHYNDRSGKGGGSHPFTGWSSLVLLIMGDDTDTAF